MLYYQQEPKQDLKQIFPIRDLECKHSRTLSQISLHWNNPNTFELFKGKQIPKMSAVKELPQEVKSVYCGENQVVLIFPNTESGDKYRLITYDFSGKEKINRTFNIEYNSVLVENERIIIYNESEILILNKRGEEKFSGSLGTNVVSIIPGSSPNKFLVVTSDKMKRVELK